MTVSKMLETMFPEFSDVTQILVGQNGQKTPDLAERGSFDP